MRPVDEILQEGIRAGQIGGESEPHGRHAMGFIAFLAQGESLQGYCVDLGTGVGIPGLILADACPDTDAIVAARSTLRGSADWVTARSFGPPADTAECASGFLRPGGGLITSEPFDGDMDARWPMTEVEETTGLARDHEWTTDAGRYLRFQRTERELPSLPRKGARKKPLF